METIPCRGCRTELDPAASACPICLRPRGALEITRGFTELRESKKRRQRLPFVVLGWLLLLGGAGWLVYSCREPLFAAAASIRARAEGVVEDAENPKSLLPAPPAEPAQAPAAPPAAPAAPAPPVVAATPVPAPPVLPAPPAPAPAPVTLPARPERVGNLPIPPLNSQSQWAFYGRVYDLITLRPVAGVQLNFQSTSNGGGMQARTDEHGRFLVVLPRLSSGSYEIRGSHPKYASPVLYEPDIPYAKLPLAQRRDIARSAQDGDMTLPPLSDVAGEESLLRNLFLAPRR
jgi:hypothetical protein